MVIVGVGLVLMVVTCVSCKLGPAATGMQFPPDAIWTTDDLPRQDTRDATGRTIEHMFIVAESEESIRIGAVFSDEAMVPQTEETHSFSYRNIVLADAFPFYDGEAVSRFALLFADAAHLFELPDEALSVEHPMVLEVRFDAELAGALVIDLHCKVTVEFSAHESEPWFEAVLSGR